MLHALGPDFAQYLATFPALKSFDPKQVDHEIARDAGRDCGRCLCEEVLGAAAAMPGEHRTFSALPWPAVVVTDVKKKSA